MRDVVELRPSRRRAHAQSPASAVIASSAASALSLSSVASLSVTSIASGSSGSSGSCAAASRTSSLPVTTSAIRRVRYSRRRAISRWASSTAWLRSIVAPSIARDDRSTVPSSGGMQCRTVAASPRFRTRWTVPAGMLSPASSNACERQIEIAGTQRRNRVCESMGKARREIGVVECRRSRALRQIVPTTKR